MPNRPPLSSDWVDLLFTRLAVRYGSAWVSKWNGVDAVAVKADWAAQLAGFVANPDALAYGLDNLPHDFPPTVTQFRDICIRRPEAGMKALPAPKADPSVVQAVKGVGKRVAGVDPREWAHRLRRREMECDRLTAAQRAMWREALRERIEEPA